MTQSQDRRRKRESPRRAETKKTKRHIANKERSPGVASTSWPDQCGQIGTRATNDMQMMDRGRGRIQSIQSKDRVHHELESQGESPDPQQRLNKHRVHTQGSIRQKRRTATKGKHDRACGWMVPKRGTNASSSPEHTLHFGQRRQDLENSGTTGQATWWKCLNSGW